MGDFMTVLKFEFEEEYEPDLSDIFWTVYTIFSLCISPISILLLLYLLRGDIVL